MPGQDSSSLRKSTLGHLLDSVIPIGLMIVLVFTALAYGTVEPWSITVFSLLVITLLALWGVKAAADRALAISMPAALWPLAALLLLGCAQSIPFKDAAGKPLAVSLDPEATRLAIEVIAYLLIVLLLSANFLVKGEKLTWFRNFIIVFGLAMAVFGLVQHFTWNGKYYWVFQPSGIPPSPFGSFVNHNHFAGYMEMIAPIPLALILLRAVRGELAMFFGFATVMMGIATVVSLSRGGMVSLFAGLMFVISLGLKPESGRRNGNGNGRGWLNIPPALARYGGAALIVLTIGVGALWMGADPVIRRMEKGELSMQGASKDPRKETFFQSRGWIWSDTAAMIQANWATGVGLGAYQTAYPIYSKQDGTIIVSQAHNDYLQALADGGIVGALLVLLFGILVFRDTARALRHRDPMKAGMALGCSGGLFALMVHSVFDFNLQLPSNALLFLVLTSVVSRVAVAATEKRVSQPHLERATGLKVAA